MISFPELLGMTALSQEDLLMHALNLQDPRYIKTTDFSNAEKQIDIHIDFAAGSRFECTICKTPNNCIHDTKVRVWRHLNFFQFKTYIHARVPRTVCQKCGSARLIARLKITQLLPCKLREHRHVVMIRGIIMNS